MRIFYCIRNLEATPSCIYNIQMLQDAGYDVRPIIGRTTENFNEILENRGLDYVATLQARNSNKYKNFMQLNGCYRKNMKKVFREYQDGDLVIFGTADSLIYIGHSLNKIKYIVCLKEMHETGKLFKQHLKRRTKKACGVICCERNRARYAKFTWRLDKLPYVLSNKPYGYPTERCLEPTSEKTANAIEKLRNKDFILYQAKWIFYPKELRQLACALRELSCDIILVLMGEIIDQEGRKKIDEIYPNTLWVGHVPAPMHLEITSYAKIGVAVYAENSLNNLFCAPNKTYEYAGFGIPTLCNDVPGLVETIGVSEAGLCTDWNNISNIRDSIGIILDNYDYYSKRALEFYALEDNVKIISSIVFEVIENTNNC